MSAPAAASARPRFVVCEDGTEYLDRFRRFLGNAFVFLPAADYGEAQALCAGAERRADGLLLDLDFRRTPPERLVDEQGGQARGLDPGTRRRLAEAQGILVLRALRRAGVALPALLFADLPDAAQAAYLERTLAPLTLVPSHVGLRDVAALMRAAIVRAPGSPGAPGTSAGG